MTRRHWSSEDGSRVEIIDLGSEVLRVPVGRWHRLLGDLLSHDDHAAFVLTLDNDPNLATT
ncbi:hypothetical protein [Candidatus Poriferisodalis sp.]|uniref:hypothetical protein n=1 Tax=Candidatus Poriferisodalis sp. TaxID=3101277 RepID=UPI003AF44FAB